MSLVSTIFSNMYYAYKLGSGTWKRPDGWIPALHVPIFGDAKYENILQIYIQNSICVQTQSIGGSKFHTFGGTIQSDLG